MDTSNIETSEKNPDALKAVSGATLEIVRGVEKKTLDRAYGVVKILSDFMPENLGRKDRQYIFDAALFSSISQEDITGERLEKYGHYFNDGQSEMSGGGPFYTAAVLEDLNVIRELVSSAREHGLADSPNQDVLPCIDDQMVKQYWERSFEPLKLDQVVEITKQSKQAFMIRAAQLLYDLNRYEERDDLDNLKDIADVESLFGPICHVAGYDALEMALSNQVGLIRREKTGRNDETASRKEYLDSMFEHVSDKHAVPREVIGMLFGNLTSDTDDDGIHAESSAGYTSGEHDVIFGDFAGSVSGNMVAGTYRKKSLESFCAKLDEQDKNHQPGIPMDLLGITVVVDNEESVSTILRGIIDCIETDSEAFTWRSSPSRKHAVQVRGSDAYVSRVSSEAGLSDANTELKYNDADGEYQVSKVTIEVHTPVDVHTPAKRTVLTEIQVLTKAARKASRRGAVAHYLYKMGYEKLTKEYKQVVAEFLESFHQWGKEPTKTDASAVDVLNATSLKNGAHFYSKLQERLAALKQGV